MLQDNKVEKLGCSYIMSMMGLMWLSTICIMP